MALTQEQFDASKIKLTKQVICSDGKAHSFWLITARYAFIRCWNDSRSLLNEVISEVGVGRESLSENVKFDEVATARSDNATFNAVC